MNVGVFVLAAQQIEHGPVAGTNFQDGRIGGRRKVRACGDTRRTKRYAARIPLRKAGRRRSVKYWSYSRLTFRGLLTVRPGPKHVFRSARCKPDCRTPSPTQSIRIEMALRRRLEAQSSIEPRGINRTSGRVSTTRYRVTTLRDKVQRYCKPRPISQDKNDYTGQRPPNQVFLANIVSSPVP